MRSGSTATSALAIGVVALALVAAGCLRPPARDRPTATPFELVTIDGETFSLDAERGRVVLLDFMAVSCEPCRRQIPQFAAVHAENPGVAVLSVDVEPTETEDDLRRFRDEIGVAWPFAKDRAALVVHYGVFSLPKQVLVAPDGRIAWETAPGEVIDGGRLGRELARV